MPHEHRLPHSFFDQPCLDVARELVGAHLVRRLPDGTELVGRLVEVEAYLGDGTDPCSHSHRGETPRNRSMFGPPGRLYAYRIYGIHLCVNVVCESEGRGAAVLFRAIEPLGGVSLMRRNRGLTERHGDLWIARGPARLARALDLTIDCDGASAVTGDVSLRRAEHVGRVERGPRVGVTKGADLPYRFFEPDCRWVSPFRSGRPARPRVVRRRDNAAPG